MPRVHHKTEKQSSATCTRCNLPYVTLTQNQLTLLHLQNEIRTCTQRIQLLATQVQLCLKYTPTSLEVRSNFAPTSLQVRSNFARSSLEVHEERTSHGNIFSVPTVQREARQCPLQDPFIPRLSSASRDEDTGGPTCTPSPQALP